MEGFAKRIRIRLWTFHKTIVGSMNESISAQDEETLKGILKAHAISFGHHVKSVRAEIENYQKDSSRMATAKISQELEETYDRCSSYKGKNLPVPASCRSNR